MNSLNSTANKLTSHFRQNDGKVPMGSIRTRQNSYNLVAQQAKQELRDVITLDHSGFDLEPEIGKVKGRKPGQVGSFVEHDVEASYRGDEKNGALSTVKTFNAGTEQERKVYTETIFAGNRITTLEYPATGYDDPTALITTVEKKHFGLTEQVTYQELDAGDFLQWEIADARKKLES